MNNQKDNILKAKPHYDLKEDLNRLGHDFVPSPDRTVEFHCTVELNLLIREVFPLPGSTKVKKTK